MDDVAIVVDNIEVSPLGMASRNMNKISSTERECPICLIETNQWREMPCCNNNLCPTCYGDWHGNLQNQTCVFCRHSDVEDIDETIQNHTVYIVSDTNRRRIGISVVCFGISYSILVILYICGEKGIKVI